jgi:CRP/FNR family transcriptional regulator
MDLFDFGLKPLGEYLSHTTLAEVLRRSQRRSFAHGQALHLRGDHEAKLCIVADGIVRFGRFQHDGSFKLLAMLGRGAHYGDIALQRRAFTQNVYSHGRAEVDVIEAAALEALLVDMPELTLALWRCNTARLNAVLELYDDARTLSVVARLAKVIYVHSGRGQLENGVACNQSDLADLLGVSKVAVGKAIRDLERAGFIQSGYRQVIVLNKPKLKAWLRKSGAA